MRVINLAQGRTLVISGPAIVRLLDVKTGTDPQVKLGFEAEAEVRICRGEQPAVEHEQQRNQP